MAALARVGMDGRAHHHAQPRCPAASSSGWPSPGPSPPIRPSSWPTSPPARWTPSTGRARAGDPPAALHEEGTTILLITHDNSIAATARPGGAAERRKNHLRMHPRRWIGYESGAGLQNGLQIHCLEKDPLLPDHAGHHHWRGCRWSSWYRWSRDRTAKNMEYFEKMGDNKIQVYAYQYYNTSGDISELLYEYCLGMQDLVSGHYPQHRKLSDHDHQIWRQNLFHWTTTTTGTKRISVKLGSDQYGVCNNYTLGGGRDVVLPGRR